MSYPNFLDEALDLVDDPMPVGLVDIGAEADFTSSSLCHGSHAEHSLAVTRSDPRDVPELGGAAALDKGGCYLGSNCSSSAVIRLLESNLVPLSMPGAQHSFGETAQEVVSETLL